MENKKVTVALANAIELTQRIASGAIAKLEVMMPDTDFTDVKAMNTTEACADAIGNAIVSRKGINIEGGTQDVI